MSVPMFKRHLEAKRFLFDALGVDSGQMFKSPAQHAIVSTVLYLDSILDLGGMKALTELCIAVKQDAEHVPLLQQLDLREKGGE